MYRILVVDDDPAQLHLRQTVFESAGFIALISLSVRATTLILENTAVDLVVMDLRFPNREGKSDSAEGLRLIRAIRERHPDVPILVLSGWTTDIEGHPEEKLITRVLLKTVTAANLLRAVREVLNIAT